MVAVLHLVCAAGVAAGSDPTRAALMPSVVTVPEAAQASDHFDPVAATNAYLSQIPAEATARSDAYFEGGYWLQLWDFLLGAALALLMLFLGWSARMRDLAQRLTHRRWLQTGFYWLQYSLLTFAIGFPLTVYEGYFREHQYGLATQTFGPWLGDQAKGLGIGFAVGGLGLSGLFAIIRRLPRTWWIWGAVVANVFAVVGIVIAPVYLVPIFNTPKPLSDARVKAEVLKLAHANGVPTDDVYEVDASRQSTRMSANVSGLGGTLRITLNDNLLKRGSPEEIRAVMGHEIGHYVLHHIYKDVLFFFVVICLGFACLRWALVAALARYGEAWGVTEVSDPAVLPLAMLVIGSFFFLLIPLTNSWIRMQEFEADMYGLNTSREPDGEAQADVHLGEYRKMNPGPLEELIFYDHPSGRNRIYAAMLWKANNLELFERASDKGSARPGTGAPPPLDDGRPKD